MRIVHVVRQYVPSVGGLEAVVSRLAGEQRRRLGHDVTVLTLDRLFSARDRRLPANETIDGVRIVRLAWTGSTRYPLCPQVIAHVRDADLVHVHAIDFFFDWLSAMRFVHRKPLVASTHGGFFHTAFASTLKRVWFDTVTRWSSKGYRRIVATSDNDGAVFRTIAGAKVVVAENGVDIDRFRGAAATDAAPVMIYFGRWSQNKGLVELLDLMQALHDRDARWRLIIAGRPYDLTSADLTAGIRERRLDGAVELHAAPSDDELRSLIGRASYFGCLSRHEGFGLAAIEAMSAGLVPVLSDIPPFRKVVQDARCGVLLPLGQSPDTRADQVLGFVASRSTDVAERARVIAFTQRYEWPLVVDRYETIYREALAPRNTAVSSVSS